MATIPLGWRTRAPYHSSAAAHAHGVVLAAPVAAPPAFSLANQWKVRAEFQRCVIRSHDPPCLGGAIGGSVRERRRQRLRARAGLKRERGIRDFGIVAGGGEWEVRARNCAAVRIFSRGRSGRGLAQSEQSGGGSVEGAEELDFDISRLEDYTERVQSEVLCVNAFVEDEEDQVIVFKGFSSSLIRATPNDQSEPMLPPTSVIVGIDRIRGPYRPSAPQYIQRGMSWRDFQTFLEEQGL